MSFKSQDSYISDSKIICQRHGSPHFHIRIMLPVVLKWPIWKAFYIYLLFIAVKGKLELTSHLLPEVVSKHLLCT